MILGTAAMLLAGCRHAPAAELFEDCNKELAPQSVPASRRAIARYEQALKLTGDPAVQLKIQTHLAEAMSIADRTRVAEALEKLLQLAREARDGHGALSARVELARFAKGSSNEQVSTLRALLDEARAAGAREAELRASIYLAAKLVGARRQTEAFPILDGATELLRATPDPRHEAEIEHQRCATYCSLGDADRALRSCWRALAIARRTRSSGCPIPSPCVAGS